MTPSTKALMEYLRDDGRIEEPEGGYIPSEGPPEFRHAYEMKLKKKHQQMMLKKMLAEAGYGDLAKMVNIGKHKYEVESEDY